MSTLSGHRDHFRRMATAEHADECPSLLRTSYFDFREGRIVKVYPPDCPGCVTEAERALFAQLADEIDAYLGQSTDVDLFGEETALPEPEASP